jgi:hypothetical protein
VSPSRGRSHVLSTHSPQPDHLARISGDDPPAPDPDGTGAGGAWRDRHPAAARVAAGTLTALAAALVLGAILLPLSVHRLTVGAFIRIPVEGVVATALLLALPDKARRPAAAVTGLCLGLLTILKLLDIGMDAASERPFDLLSDWPLISDGASALRSSVGRADALTAEITASVLVIALPPLMTLAVLRLSRLMAQRRSRATRATVVAATAWMVCAAIGLQICGLPFASTTTAALVGNKVRQVRADLNNRQAFAKRIAQDRYGSIPPDQLLTALRGKDVIFTFIESYGRGAVEDPGMAPGVDAVLDAGTAQLRSAGYSSESAWLTSPTFGGGSWLAHSTLMSGQWITGQQRYNQITSSDEMSLPDAFRRTGAWRTVGIMPGVTRAWPEAKYYGLDHVYDSHHLGYAGPTFGWSTMPDQYVLSAFQRLEHGVPGSKPLMSEIILTSSHEPWAPIPTMVDEDRIGDGTVYNAIKAAGKQPGEVWRELSRIRTEYARSVEYSLNSLLSFVEKHGNKNTVLVFLGDHQPASVVSGDHASHDVPIAIVAHDPDVLKRISGWGWQEGLKPGPQAPVWRMDAFRNRFLTAFGSGPGAGAGTPTAR